MKFEKCVSPWFGVYLIITGVIFAHWAGELVAGFWGKSPILCPFMMEPVATFNQNVLEFLVGAMAVLILATISVLLINLASKLSSVILKRLFKHD